MKKSFAILCLSAAALLPARAATLDPLAPLPAISSHSTTSATSTSTTSVASATATAINTPPKNPVNDMPSEVVTGIGGPMMMAMNDPGLKAAHQKVLDNVTELNGALRAVINRDMATKNLMDKNPVLFGYLETRVSSALKAPPDLLKGQSPENIKAIDAVVKTAQSDASVQAALKKGPEQVQQFKDAMRVYLSKDAKVKALIDKYPDDYSRLVEYLASAPFGSSSPSPRAVTPAAGPRGTAAPATTGAPRPPTPGTPAPAAGA